MTILTRAHQELFRRTEDECFPTLQALWEHTSDRKQQSYDHWHPPQNLHPAVDGAGLTIDFGDDGPYRMNRWSFSQLCRLAGVSKDTINRLSPQTACRALEETIPSAAKPVQLLTTNKLVRSIHGVSYTRLWDVDLLTMLREFATDFQPPQQAGGPDDGSANGESDSNTAPTTGTGLYCGDEDMFVFMVDPLGWTEINGEAFAPGFFLWNSEVGRRSVGVQTFWFQAVCQNHIVWDTVNVMEFTRKHTTNVHESLNEIRSMVESLVNTRDERKDGFAKTIKKAMEVKLAASDDDAFELLGKRGFAKTLARQAIEIAKRNGGLTIFSVVDALTRLSRKSNNAGNRTEADIRAGQLLALAS